MDKKKYEQLVKETAEIRTEIDEVHWARYTQLRKAFEGLTGLKGSIFKKVNDLIYYKGGYPSENSPPKAEVFADEVAYSLRMLNALDKDFAKNLLVTRGIKVEFMENKSFVVKDRPEFEKHLGTEYWKEGMSSSQVLEKMVNEAQELQGTICEMADEIKIDAAEKAEKEFEIQKPSFMRAVKLESMIQRKGQDEKTKEKVDKAIEAAENMVEALEPIAEKFQNS